MKYLSYTKRFEELNSGSALLACCRLFSRRKKHIFNGDDDDDDNLGRDVSIAPAIQSFAGKDKVKA